MERRMGLARFWHRASAKLGPAAALVAQRGKLGPERFFVAPAHDGDGVRAGRLHGR